MSLTDFIVIGFDLRQGPVMSSGVRHSLKSLAPNDRQGRIPYPATITSSVWPRHIDFCFDELNEFGLLCLPDFNSESGNIVSLRVAFIAKKSKFFGGTACSAELLLSTRGWRSLGFDIVDRYAQHSAWYGFSWEAGELEAHPIINTAEFNKHGLLIKYQDAEVMAACFDTIIPEHSSFFPCEVYVQEILEAR
jgi:hypothetical protein